MGSSYHFVGSGSEGFGFLHNPPVIIDNEQGFEDGFDNSFKRLKLTPLNQIEINFPFEPSNDLSPEEDDDFYPLGLKLRKTPSFLDLVEMKLSEKRFSHSISTQITSPLMLNMSSEDSAAQPISEKLKASNFAAKLLRIGSWERVTRYEGDLVAKFYYAKRKLVWEVLDYGLKSKIEIQWSDISAIRATFPENQPGILEVELCNLPLFFGETNPQPRKHTLWQAGSDFTGDQASRCRRHFIQFPEGTLEKHYEKLLQCDFRLNLLSRKPFPSSSSPYFESCKNGYQDYPHRMNDHRPKFEPGFHYAVQDMYSLPLPNFAPIRAIADPCRQVQLVQKFESFRPSIGVEELNSPNSENTGTKVYDEQQTTSSENGDYRGGFGSRRGEHIQEVDSPIGYHMAGSYYPHDCNLPRRYSYNVLPSEAGMDRFSSDKTGLDEIAADLLSDQLVAICTDEQKIMKKIKSMCSLIDADSTYLEVKMDQINRQNYMKNSVLESLDQGNLGDMYHGLNLAPIQELGYENPSMHHLSRITSFPTLFLDESDDSATGETNGVWN